MRLQICIGLLIVLFVGAICFAQENTDRLTELQKKIMAQQKVLNDLEKQLEEKENTSRKYTEQIVSEYLSEPEAKDAAAVVAGYKNGFFIKDSSGDFEFRVTGYTKQDVFLTMTRMQQENSVVPLEFRPDFNFYFMKDWHVRIVPEFIGNGSLRDGYVEYLGIPYLKFRLGQFKVPFSGEVLQRGDDGLAIMPTPFISCLPGRDIGFSIFGDGLPFFLGEFIGDYVGYSVSVFNGNGMNTLNNEDDMMFLAEGKFFPLTNKEKEVYIRAAFLSNETKRRESGANITLFGNMRTNVHSVFGANANTTRDDNDTCGGVIGVDLSGHYEKDNLRIELEYVWVRFNRDKADYNGDGVSEPTFTPLEMWGFSGAISYFIALNEEGKEKLGVEPIFKFSYTTIDDNGKKKDDTGAVIGATDGQDVWEIMLGARFHVNQHMRIDFNWTMYDLSDTKNYHPRDGEGGQLIHSFVFQFIFRW